MGGPATQGSLQGSWRGLPDIENLIQSLSHLADQRWLPVSDRHCEFKQGPVSAKAHDGLSEDSTAKLHGLIRGLRLRKKLREPQSVL